MICKNVSNESGMISRETYFDHVFFSGGKAKKIDIKIDIKITSFHFF